MGMLRAKCRVGDARSSASLEAFGWADKTEDVVDQTTGNPVECRPRGESRVESKE